MRRTFLLQTVAAVFVLAMAAGVASAAQISQISWDVTGGTFDGLGGNNLSGPITGGSMVFTPHGSISTPLMYTATPIIQGAQVHLSLTGPAGTFSILMAPGYARIYISPNDISLRLPRNSVHAVSGLGSHTFVFAELRMHYNTANSPRGHGDIFGPVMGGTAAVSHDFTTGNEVRTIVPEAGTPVLLGLGLLGLGWVARPRGAIARTLRHRRG